MNITHFADITARSTGSLLLTLSILRRLPFVDFGNLIWGMPNPTYVGLSRVLPTMASREVQQGWTGSDGKALLRQSLSFIDAVRTRYELNGSSLRKARILDFGCGYGRLLRLMLYYAQLQRLYGCDPWRESIELCHKDRVPGQIAISQEVPIDLPFDSVVFDLIYAYSIFTHLSERTATACVNALRRRIAPSGSFIFTVRPKRYWDSVKLDVSTRAKMLKLYEDRGFSFLPHQRTPIDGDITFGEAAVAVDYLRCSFANWEFSDPEPFEGDPLQSIICARPR